MSFPIFSIIHIENINNQINNQIFDFRFFLFTLECLAISYNLDEIYREEEKRLQDIKERLHKQISIFNEKPVVFFDLESPYFDFEPEDVHSLDTLGTLYSHIRVSDNWGKLTVNRHGCLISDNYKQLRITAKGLKIDRNHVYGEGWQMILNETWVIEEMDENYFVRRIAP